MNIFHEKVTEKKDGARAVEGRRARKVCGSTLLNIVQILHH